jgi:hypothetical protein
MTRSFLIAVLVASPVLFTAVPALAEDGGATVSVVRSQFTDKVENRLPVGEASPLVAGKLITYWVEVNNPGDATDVTLVWKLDGKEVSRQSLEVGRAPHWRTWGMCGTQKAHSVEIEVLDKEGHSLKTDSATVS